MTATHTPEREARSAAALLADPTFGSFFGARLVTSIGIWLHGVVAAIAAFDATRSAVAVGVVSAVQFLPQLALAPISGKWADRGDVKRQMLLGRAISAAGSLALAVWFLAAPDATGWTSASAIAAASLIVGMGLVVGGPAMQSAVPLLVTREELPAAMALNAAPITIGRIAGPAVGAITAAGLGYEWAFMFAVIAHLLFLALVGWISFPTPEGRREGDTFSVREAVAYVRHDRPTLLVLVGVTALGLGSEPTVTLAPPLAAALGGGASTVGGLTASMGIGAAIGVVVTATLGGRVRHEVTSTLGMLLMAVGMAACAAPIGTAASMACFGLTGFGFIVSVSSLSTLMQLRLPAVLRGRVMALWLMGFVGSRPIGALAVGAVADSWDVRASFACVAVAMLVAAWVCRPSRLTGTPVVDSEVDTPSGSVNPALPD